jgi:tRNA(fMet)-specific endonuclease VapC
MAMTRIVLDTNAYTALARGDERARQVIEEAETVYLPIFVYAELLFGFKNGTRTTFNQEKLRQFLSLPGVMLLLTTEETARIFAELALQLKRQSTPIPHHDIWIAACAVETGSVVITYDKHFLHMNLVRCWSSLSE